MKRDQKCRATATDRHVAEMRADEATRIGTSRYAGYGYFWHTDFKYPLRDVSRAQRRRVHDAFLAAGLTLNGTSRAHRVIIDLICGTSYPKIYGTPDPTKTWGGR